VTVSVYTERVLFSCKSIWMSSGGGPDPLDPPLIYATAKNDAIKLIIVKLFSMSQTAHCDIEIEKMVYLSIH
jgi:hypothetical protein